MRDAEALLDRRYFVLDPDGEGLVTAPPELVEASQRRALWQASG